MAPAGSRDALRADCAGRPARCAVLGQVVAHLPLLAGAGIGTTGPDLVRPHAPSLRDLRRCWDLDVVPAVAALHPSLVWRLFPGPSNPTCVCSGPSLHPGAQAPRLVGAWALGLPRRRPSPGAAAPRRKGALRQQPGCCRRRPLLWEGVSPWRWLPSGCEGACFRPPWSRVWGRVWSRAR